MSSPSSVRSATRLSDAVEIVRRAGGVARVRVLTAGGVSPHVIGRALEQGALHRVRKGWLALPDADAFLVAAARAGVVLTCVTQARRLGLWVLHDGPPHLGAPAHSGGVTPTGGHVHWARPPVPRHPDALADPIENVLAIAAACQPYEVARAIWESAIAQHLVAVAALRRLPLGPAARDLCDDVTPWSDSGLESIVSPRLRWLRLPIYPQAWILGHRTDFLIGERLVLQIDGGHHVGAQRATDVAHDALLALHGYHVIRVTYAQVIDHWHEVQDLIMRAVAQGLHLAS
jgi:very-short-patch-repair endonuclease